MTGRNPARDYEGWPDQDEDDNAAAWEAAGFTVLDPDPEEED